MQKYRSRYWILGLFVSALALTLATPESQARQETIQLRKARQAKAEERWTSPERVTINVHYRVPVIETLGYLAAFYPDNQKLTTVAERLRPIAEEVVELSGNSFRGRSFPPEVADQCADLRNLLFSIVEEVYGKEVSQSAQAYIHDKYQFLTSGLFSPIES